MRMDGVDESRFCEIDGSQTPKKAEPPKPSVPEGIYFISFFVYVRDCETSWDLTSRKCF